MKHIIISIMLLTGLFTYATDYTPMDGDIVFARGYQNAPPFIAPDGTPFGTTGPMIESVQGSDIMHCGIVIVESEGVFVIEAGGAGPFVAKTPLDEWIARSGVWEVKRLWFAEWIPGIMRTWAETAETRVGEPYDFGWSPGPELMYCSEIVDWAFPFKEFGLPLACWQPFDELVEGTPVDPYTSALFGLPTGMMLSQFLPMLGFDLSVDVLTPEKLYRSYLLRSVQ